MLFDWQFALSILPQLARAAVVTIEATLLGFVVAAVLGLGLALLRRSENPWISTPTGGLIEFIRSTPVLIQIFFLYFVFPRFGIVIPAFTAGVMALGLHYACYCSEVYRAGLEGIPRGQWEAAIALNLSPARTYWDVIIPQAIPPVVPALGNYLIGMFKETPLLVGDRGRRADADRQDHRLRDLPLPRADHHGRHLLPDHEPGLGGRRAPGRGVAEIAPGLNTRRG